MKIDPNQYLANIQSDAVQNPRNVNQEHATSGAAGSETLAGGDTIQFSAALTQIQQLKARLEQTPEVRGERVAALQKKISQGAFKPSNEKIADAMVSDLFTSSTRRS